MTDLLGASANSDMPCPIQAEAQAHFVPSRKSRFAVKAGSQKVVRGGQA
jgi:hypothetical protein